MARVFKSSHATVKFGVKVRVVRVRVRVRED
jgi:hypothetical protein